MGTPVPMKVLSETQSGFALFVFNGSLVTAENPLEILWPTFVNSTTAGLHIWLLEFQKIEDKSTTTGIDEHVMKMIKKNGILGRHFLLESLSIKKLLKKNWSASALFSRFHLCSIYQCIQKLLSIWQNIPCCCDEAAMEVMWGVENLLHILVPDEETELREDDRTLRSKGLHMFLQSLGYNIEKELVNGQIAETACFIYHCIEINKEQLKCLRRIDYLEKEGIDTQDWDALKYATAISIMCMDEPSSETRQVFSEEELQKINGGKGKHKGLIKDNFMFIYKRAIDVSNCKVEKLKELDALVKVAQERSGRAGKLQEDLDKPESVGADAGLYEIGSKERTILMHKTKSQIVRSDI